MVEVVHCIPTSPSRNFVPTHKPPNFVLALSMVFNRGATFVCRTGNPAGDSRDSGGYLRDVQTVLLHIAEKYDITMSLRERGHRRHSWKDVMVSVF